MMKRAMLFGTLTMLGLLLVLGAPAPAAAQSPQELNLTLTEFMISPMAITVNQGQPVHFTVTNAGKYPHNVTFVYEGKVTNLLAAPLKGSESGTADFTFNDAGAWEMHCPVDGHAAKGMVGSVQVMAASAGAPTGMPATGAPAGPELLLLVLLAAALFNAGLFLRRRRTPDAA